MADAGPGEFAVLLGSNWSRGAARNEALDAARGILEEKYRADPQDLTAAQIANTTIALLRLGRADESGRS